MYYLMHSSQCLETLYYLLIQMFFSHSILFWWMSVISFSFCADCKCRHILKAVWKSTTWSRYFCVFFPSKGIACCLNFWSTWPLVFQNIVLMKMLGNFPLKHPFWSPLFKYIYRPSRFAKEHSPSEVCVHFRHVKESMPKKC